MKKIWMIIFILNVFLYAQEIKLDAFIEDGEDSWDSFVFYDNQRIAYSKESDVYIYDLENKKSEKLFTITTESEQLEKDGYIIGFFKSLEPKRLLMELYSKNSRSNYVEYYIYNGKIEILSKDQFRKLKSLESFFHSDTKTGNWKINLLDNYYYSYEGEVIDILPYIGYSDNKEKIYFINYNYGNIDNLYNKYFKPFSDSFSCIDVSMDKFRIMFWGWTTKGLGYGDIAGDLSGIFIFKLTYDGIITEDTGVYNIKEGDLLEDSKLLLSKDLKVKVKAIKEIQNNKYYQIEYEDGKNGWVSESVVKIGSE